MKDVIRESVITCPECGCKKLEIMPTDSCLYFFTCDNCGQTMTPRAGDCCVFCSYGSEKCPPMQSSAN